MVNLPRRRLTNPPPPPPHTHTHLMWPGAMSVKVTHLDSVCFQPTLASRASCKMASWLLPFVAPPCTWYVQFYSIFFLFLSIVVSYENLAVWMIDIRVANPIIGIILTKSYNFGLLQEFIGLKYLEGITIKYGRREKKIINVTGRKSPRLKDKRLKESLSS